MGLMTRINDPNDPRLEGWNVDSSMYGLTGQTDPMAWQSYGKSVPGYAPIPATISQYGGGAFIDPSMIDIKYATEKNNKPWYLTGTGGGRYDWSQQAPIHDDQNSGTFFGNMLGGGRQGASIAATISKLAPAVVAAIGTYGLGSGFAAAELAPTAVEGASLAGAELAEGSLSGLTAAQQAALTGSQIANAGIGAGEAGTGMMGNVAGDAGSLSGVTADSLQGINALAGSGGGTASGLTAAQAFNYAKQLYDYYGYAKAAYGLTKGDYSGAASKGLGALSSYLGLGDYVSGMMGGGDSLPDTNANEGGMPYTTDAAGNAIAGISDATNAATSTAPSVIGSLVKAVGIPAAKAMLSGGKTGVPTSQPTAKINSNYAAQMAGKQQSWIPSYVNQNLYPYIR